MIPFSFPSPQNLSFEEKKVQTPLFGVRRRLVWRFVFSAFVDPDKMGRERGRHGEDDLSEM